MKPFDPVMAAIMSEGSPDARRDGSAGPERTETQTRGGRTVRRLVVQALQIPS